MSGLVQWPATYLLVLHGRATGSVADLPARALLLGGLAMPFRLPCTVRLDGCLPVNASYDYLRQMIDGVPLTRTFWLFDEVIGR